MPSADTSCKERVAVGDTSRGHSKRSPHSLLGKTKGRERAKAATLVQPITERAVPETSSEKKGVALQLPAKKRERTPAGLRRTRTGKRGEGLHASLFRVQKNHSKTGAGGEKKSNRVMLLHVRYLRRRKEDRERLAPFPLAVSGYRQEEGKYIDPRQRRREERKGP